MPIAMSNTIEISEYQAYRRLIDVGLAMSSEKNLPDLLDLILLEAKKMTRSDGGTIYLHTRADSLEFAVMVNDSLDIHNTARKDSPIDLPEVPLSKANGELNLSNVAAAAAILGQTIVVDDVYLNEEYDFTGTRIFDEMLGYRSCSFLTVSLKNYAGDCIGVLQLLNSRTIDGEVTSYDLKRIPLVESLASLASIAIENRLLLDEKIEREKVLEGDVVKKSEELSSALTELSEAHEVIETSSTTDSVTGINNRRYFEEVLDQEWRRAKRQKYDISIALIGLDGLEQIAKEYGVEARDICLGTCAREAEAFFKRPSDFVASYVPGEIVVLLPYATLAETAELAEVLRKLISSRAIIIHGNSLSVTASIGVATLSASGDFAPGELSSRAEKAMSKAKEHGCDLVFRYSEDES